jgi:hypothetical protein
MMRVGKCKVLTAFAEGLDRQVFSRYVNREVRYMLKKLLLFIFAVLQLLCANLSVNYSVSFGGQELPGTFSGDQIARCRTAAGAALDEIDRGNAAAAEFSIRGRCSLRGADGDVRQLTDAIITSDPGAARYCEVYVSGAPAGTVSDPALLEDSPLYSLHNYSAVMASGSLELRPVYSYAGRESDIFAVCSAIGREAGKFT